MDVTSLLNSGTEVSSQHGQRRHSGTPSRSRIPWGAGGYLLPLNTTTCPAYSMGNNGASSQATPLRFDSEDSQFDIPKRNETSFRHKSFSSRSSLSSTTSSLLSTTHSRLSSLSTVNSCYPGQSSVFMDKISFMSESIPRCLDLTSLDATDDQSTVISPTISLGTLALVAEQHSSADRARSVDRRPATLETIPPDGATTSMPLQEALSQGRPRSPSDAVLIKRLLTPVLHSSIRENDLNDLTTEHDPFLNFSITSTLRRNQPTSIRLHKRCVSAPDISSTMDNPSIRQPAGMRPEVEPTPPPSQHAGSSSPTNSIYPTPDTPPTITADSEAGAVVCMYIENCDTGSQPRKAISHIFGRNKMCTRLIPSHVWVHYCRKHYQRSRYRNPKEYAKLQCDLIQQQIRRVHEWSAGNVKNGASGVVQDWGLSVRKREKKRLDGLGGTNRKRSATILDQDDADDVDDLPGVTDSAIPATAVPDWLLALCGKGYTTHAILGIFNQLHTEILADRMACFPDIEILPNIAVDQNDARSSKNGTKRRARAIGHRRTQSLGVAAGAESHSPDEGASELFTGDMSADALAGQMRRRPVEEDLDDFETFLPRPSRSVMGDSSADTGRRVQHLAHRPVFDNITEDQADEDNHAETQQGNTYARFLVSHQSPLPVTNRQTSPSLSEGAVQSQGNFHHGSRQEHGRSQSHITASNRGISLGQRPLSSHFDGQTLQQEQAYSNNSTFYPPQKFTTRMEMQQVPSLAHSRHQTIPTAYSSSNEPFIQSLGARSNTSHGRTNSTVLHRSRQVYETQGTRDLYSARR